MLKRYSYRAHPTLGQQRDLSRIFGSVRVVFNDVIAERRRAHQAGEPFQTASKLQTLVVTKAKLTPERSWLTEVSSTPLEQAVRDADLAYRNFFNSLSGKRKGRKVGAPRFKKRRSRQTARFTRSAGFSVRETTHGVAHLRVPKVGWVKFVLSRPPTQKPLRVLKRLIQLSSREGDIVFTPFSGSGSECLAAKEMGRHFIGFELETEYVNISRERLAHAQLDGPKQKSERPARAEDRTQQNDTLFEISE